MRITFHIKKWTITILVKETSRKAKPVKNNRVRGSLFTVIIGQAGAFVNPGPAGIFSIVLAKRGGIVYSVAMA